MPSGHRSWCFTLNNPTLDEANVLPTPDNPTRVQYVKFCCYQLEQGELETPHLQGYIQFRCQRSFNVVKSLLPRAHWEIAGGSPAKNLAYCTKLDGRLSEPVIVGRLPGTRGGGDSSDEPQNLGRSDVVKLIQDNPEITEDDIIDEGGLSVLVFNPNILGLTRGYLNKDIRRLGVTCELYYGDSGLGKSRLADTRYPNAYRKTDGHWWDGYSGESVVILDDFDGDFMSTAAFLRLVDRYPLQSQVKGGFVRNLATHFIITSNLLPNAWWPGVSRKRYEAIARRINKVLVFEKDCPVYEYDGHEYLVKDNYEHRSVVLPPWELEEMVRIMDEPSTELFLEDPDVC